MGKFYIFLIMLFLCILVLPAASKTIGNFKKYQQITDKEVLIETTTGVHILVSAHNHYALQITAVNKRDAVNLISPQKIHLNQTLTGSIYVEELDELMQITTTVSDGIVIKVEKQPLRLSFVDKTSGQVLTEEVKGVNFGKQRSEIIFAMNDYEKMKLITGNQNEIKSNNLENGNTYLPNVLNEMVFPNNKICITSSRGYSVVFESDQSHQIDLSKPEKLKISKQSSNSDHFDFMLIYGSMQPELIEKYALSINPKDQQITLK